MIAYFFLPLFFILTPIGLYLLIKQRNNRLLVWGGSVVLVAGLSGLQVGLEKIALPYWMETGVSESWVIIFQIISSILNIVIHTFPYYLILVFFILYAGFSNTILNVLLFTPVLLSFAFCDIYPSSQMNYTFIMAWGIPYFLASIVLFGWISFTNRNLGVNWPHMAIATIFFVPEISLLLYQLDDRITEPYFDLLLYIPFICVISIILGSVLYAHNAFLGLQRKTILTKMQFGTTLMQHAFKNAIGKSKLNVLNIQRSLSKKDYANIDQYLQSLLLTNEHLLNMISKLSYLTRNNLPAELELCDISSVIDEVIDIFRDYTGISFVKEYSPMVVPLDRTLVTECLTNIISNAVEAIDGCGSIVVSLVKTNRKVSVTIADTGKGMTKKELKNVFDPFFSTKVKSGKHFGLGMLHVQKIMESHQGKVRISSEVGVGSIVTLFFPLKKRD